MTDFMRFELERLRRLANPAPNDPPPVLQIPLSGMPMSAEQLREIRLDPIFIDKRDAKDLTSPGPSWEWFAVRRQEPKPGAQ